MAHVYCLNRSCDGLLLQTERNKARGLSTQLSSTRTTILAADLSQTHLCPVLILTANKLKKATLVIHNAWPVNFNLSLSSFRPQLAALVNLIEFTASAVTSSHLFFISSISSVLSYHSALLQTPEQVILDSSAPNSTSYVESKYISERLLDHAARRLPINTSFTRVGQVAGAVEYPGLWNEDEWFPSLVISPLHIGAVPDSLVPSLSRIDWIPIDLQAWVIVELALTQEQAPDQDSSQCDLMDTLPSRREVRVFHPLNPHPTTWETVRPIVADALFSLTGKRLETVSLDVWLAKVRREIELAAGSHQALEDGELDLPRERDG